MSFIGSFAFGQGPTSARTQTRGRIQGGPSHGVAYPHPFFDVAHTYLPVTVKQMFRWCRYYFLTNPLVNAAVFKLSEYPVTDIVIDHENASVVRDWTEYFQDHLNYRPFQVETGLDYHTFGNCMISISYPFVKYLTCSKCGFQEMAKKIRNKWVFTNFTFRLTCPKCGTVDDATAFDFYYKNASGIRLIRWNVEDIEVKYNPMTGEALYFYTIPPTIRNDILIGKKDVVEGIPQVFVQALRQEKGIVLSKDNFFHFKRPTLAQHDRGWGTPLILPVLKDTFYLQIMKKAQEAILLEHIVPLRIMFPQPGSGSSDPYTTVNLREWRDHVAQEIARWRYDNNYIPIMPLPIGNQSFGGDGRALLLTQEIQIWSEHIINGMHVPLEFIKGGLSYAGTNVSMRMLENQFIGYILRHKQLARWVMKCVANYMEWPEASVRFKPFKMADDIQRKAYLFQLNQAQKISDTTLLADADLSQEEEDEIMLRETDKRLESTKKQQLAMAEVQAEAQLIMMKSQVKGQQVMMEAQQAPPAPGEPGGPEGMAPPMLPPGQAPSGQEGPQAVPPGVSQSPTSTGQDLGVPPGQAPPMGVDIQTTAQQIAEQIMSMPPDQQQMALQNIQAQSPELAQLVQQFLSQMQPPQQGAGVDMRPLPEQLPPRRVAPPV
jgi:hypothetical protein